MSTAARSEVVIPDGKKMKAVKSIVVAAVSIASLAFALSPASSQTTPAPAASPTLKEIGRSRSTLYCSMLRSRIAPTLQGLIKNDQAIGEGHRALSKMSDDAGSNSSPRLDMDRNYLAQVVTVTAHNLDIIKKLLSDPSFFKENPVTDDDRSANALKANLQQVAAQQNQALNLLNGALESDLMGQMQSERNIQMQNATGLESAAPTTPVDPSQFMSVAGLPDHPINSALSQQNLGPGNVRKHNIYDSLAAELDVRQHRIASSEKTATQAVVAAVPLCTSPRTPSTPNPLDTPTPRPERTPIPIVIPTN